MADSFDRWHRWLLNVRFGGDADARQSVLTERYLVRDKAQVQPGGTLLNVGRRHTDAGLCTVRPSS
jgi:hypothetical protein